MPIWLTVLTVLIFAAFCAGLLWRLQSIDTALWQSRLIIYKRLEIYDKIAPDLNRIYCFRRYLGYWKEISPPDLIVTKRRLDKHVNINRYLLSEEFYRAYLDFMAVTFRTFTGQGEDAKIRAVVVHDLGDRRVHSAYDWDEGYEYMFDAEDLPTDYQVDEAYMMAMNGLRKCMGLRD